MPTPEPRADEPGRRPVLVRSRAILPELRPSEQRIASLFAAEPATIAELSIAELAAPRVGATRREH